MKRGPANFAFAFGRQALSDLHVYEKLRSFGSGSTPKCHSLHDLQMAAEKACKAHLYSKQTGDIDFIGQHAVVEKVLELLTRRRAYGKADRDKLLRVARAIDRLAPGVDRQKTPENTEYPWLNSTDEVVSPLDHPFSEIDEEDRSFASVIKIIRRTALDLGEELQ